MQTVKRALGHVHIGLGECSAEVFETQAVGSKRGGIRLNANGGTLAAADANQSDAGKLGDFLREGGVRQVFHLGKRKAVRSKGERQNRRVRRIDLTVDGRIGQALWEEIRGAIDGRLNFLLGDVNVEVEHELQGDEGASERTRRGHLIQPGDLAELAFERRGHRRSHDLGAAAGIKRLHLNGGVIDLRQSRDRQLPVGDPAHQNDSHHEECGGNRPQNKRPRRAHRREPPDWRRGELGAGGALGFPGVALVDACAPPLFPLAIVGATLLPS